MGLQLHEGSLTISGFLNLSKEKQRAASQRLCPWPPARGENGEMHVLFMPADQSVRKMLWHSRSPSSSSCPDPTLFNSTFTNDVCGAALAGWGDGNERDNRLANVVIFTCW